MGKQEISQKAGMSLDQAVGYIESVIEGIRRGVLTIETGDKSVTIHPGRLVEFEIEATRKKEKESVTIELTWRQEDKTQQQEDGCQLRISAEEPPAESDSDEDSEDEDHGDSHKAHKVG
jgi:amphi-Trp domain-containing protein